MLSLGGYVFKNGVILYRFPQVRGVRRDDLSVKFSTTRKDAVLVSVDSKMTTTPDFLRLYLVRESTFAVLASNVRGTCMVCCGWHLTLVFLADRCLAN